MAPGRRGRPLAGADRGFVFRHSNLAIPGAFPLSQSRTAPKSGPATTIGSNMRRQLLSGLALGVTLAIGTAALAAPPSRTRGTIESVNGDTVTVTTRQGQKIEAKLASDTGVASVSQAQFSDIKPDTYIGTAAAPQPDGTLKALEVTVFDPKLRGVGDGHYPWDLGGSDTTMTNGAVGALQGANGHTLAVKYQGGEKQVVVPDDVPVVLLAPANRDIIKPGARVVVFGDKGGNGTVDAKFMVVGINGTQPPM